MGWPESTGPNIHLGVHEDDATATAYAKTAKVDTVGDGSGDPQYGAQYYNTTYNDTRHYTSTGWESLGGGGGAIEWDDVLFNQDADMLINEDGNLLASG